MPNYVDEEKRSNLAAARGRAARGIEDDKARKDFIAEQGKRESKSGGRLSEDDYNDLASSQRNQENLNVIKGMKAGGPVKKTGIYLLHQGEHVVPANIVQSVRAKNRQGARRNSVKKIAPNTKKVSRGKYGQKANPAKGGALGG